MSEVQTRTGPAKGRPAGEVRPREAKAPWKEVAGVRHWVMPVQLLVGQLALPEAKARLMRVEEVEVLEIEKGVKALGLWVQQRRGVVAAPREVPMGEVLEQLMEEAGEGLQELEHQAEEVDCSMEL